MLQPTFGTTWPSKQVTFTHRSWDHSSLQEGSPSLVVLVTQHQFNLIVPRLSDWIFVFFLDLVPKVFPLSLTQGLGGLSVHEGQSGLLLFLADLTATGILFIKCLVCARYCIKVLCSLIWASYYPCLVLKEGRPGEHELAMDAIRLDLNPAVHSRTRACSWC